MLKKLLSKIKSLFKKKKYVETTMSSVLKEFVDEQIDNRIMFEAEHLESLFPKKNFSGEKIVWKKYEKLNAYDKPFTEEPPYEGYYELF